MNTWVSRPSSARTAGVGARSSTSTARCLTSLLVSRIAAASTSGRAIGTRFSSSERLKLRRPRTILRTRSAPSRASPIAASSSARSASSGLGSGTLGGSLAPRVSATTSRFAVT